MNPYQPPKAPVRDPAEPPRLPRWLRVARAAGIAGNVLLGVLALVTYVALTEAALFVVASGLILLSVASVRALLSGTMYWTAMLVNALAVVLLNLAPGPGTVLFIAPALLNMTVIELLRRARARLAA